MLATLTALGALVLAVMSGCGSGGIAGAQRPQFTKEGELWFVRQATGEQIVRIDIEIAETLAERTRGLMYRRTLPANAGMLFIFEQAGPLAFWMKNTYIPLDMVFVSEGKKIVSIARNTTPLSQERIPSGADAMYVVEVNAGFCDAHEVKVGDAMEFRRTAQ